jgi:type I restriction enzyme S subunit
MSKIVENEKQALVPRLRFPEFRDAGEWGKKSLDSIAVFYKGKGISKADIDPQGKMPCIRYGELYTSYDEVISVVISKTNLPASELFLSKSNDVLIPSSGETKLDIAKASCVLLDDVALGGDLNILRSNENGIFLSYLLNGSYKKEIAKKAQGDTVVHLYASQLKLLKVVVPRATEQQRIADCLTSLDALIAAHSEKLDALKTHKKGLMQQLFPREGETIPRLRFPEFRDAGEWDENTLGGAATFINGRAYKQEELLDKGKYRVLRVGNFFSNNQWYYSDLELDDDKYCDDGDLLYAWSASFGPRIWKGEKTIYHYHIWKVVEKNGINQDFLFILLDYETERMKAKSANGLGLLHITKATIEGWQCRLPKIKEQQKIADCLTSLDALILAQAEKLDALKTLKKGLMQQLFPVVEGGRL